MWGLGGQPEDVFGDDVRTHCKMDKRYYEQMNKGRIHVRKLCMFKGNDDYAHPEPARRPCLIFIYSDETATTRFAWSARRIKGNSFEAGNTQQATHSLKGLLRHRKYLKIQNGAESQPMAACQSNV